MTASEKPWPPWQRTVEVVLLDLGNTVRKEREAQGMSVEELAARTDSEASVIQSVESERYVMPLLNRLARALNVQPEQLVTRPESAGRNLWTAPALEFVNNFFGSAESE